MRKALKGCKKVTTERWSGTGGKERRGGGGEGE